MPSFKPKANKKISSCKKSTITLDSKHSEKIEEFKKIKEIILPGLIKEKNNLKQLLRNQDLSIEQELEYKDKIKDIKKTIGSLIHKEKEYFLNKLQCISDAQFFLSCLNNIFSQKYILF